MQSKFGFDTGFMETLFNGEEPVEDIYGNYYVSGVGTLKLKFFDSTFIHQGVSYFRPFIRGFLVLLMALYNIRMVLSFIRQDAGVVAGKAVRMSSKEE